MRTLALTLVAALLLMSPALAQAGSTYDWKSGNYYTWHQRSDGTTDLYGSNFNTGSQWRTTIKPDGEMNGWDSRGNYWRYDSRTGNYWNTDGTMCFGKGWSRTCY